MLRGSAVVTGAAQGIGLAIARALHREGRAVVLADRNAAGAAAAAAELGARAHAHPVDVAERGSFARLLSWTDRDVGPLEVLVNCAARTDGGAFFELDDRIWDEVMATNLRSVFIGCQLAGRLLRDHGRGRIVNLASLAGQQGGAVAGAHYACSKAGILVLTKIAATELAPSGVTVNAVAPAAIGGPVLDGLSPAARERVRARIPVGRFGTPDEVAALVAFLASDAAGYITGATFDVNGGLFMR